MKKKAMLTLLVLLFGILVSVAAYSGETYSNVQTHSEMRGSPTTAKEVKRIDPAFKSNFN